NKIAAKDDFGIGTHYNRITTGVSRKATNLNLARAEVQNDALLVNDHRCDSCFREGPQLRRDLIAEHSEVLGANPSAYVALRKNYRAGIEKNTVSRNVVQMIVSVNDESHRQLRHLADVREELCCRFGTPECINDRHAVIADQKSCV